MFQLISSDVVLGENVIIHNFVNLYGCVIGSNTKIGSFVEIQKNVFIGNNCKISSHSFICEGVKIGDEVFIGHNVTFINDNYPRATNNNGFLKSERDWQLLYNQVDRRVSVGSGAVILGNIQIGEMAIIGAGSVLTKSVNAYEIFAGNPAKKIGEVER